MCIHGVRESEGTCQCDSLAVKKRPGGGRKLQVVKGEELVSGGRRCGDGEEAAGEALVLVVTLKDGGGGR